MDELRPRAICAECEHCRISRGLMVEYLCEANASICHITGNRVLGDCSEHNFKGTCAKFEPRHVPEALGVWHGLLRWIRS